MTAIVESVVFREIYIVRNCYFSVFFLPACKDHFVNPGFVEDEFFNHVSENLQVYEFLGFQSF